MGEHRKNVSIDDIIKYRGKISIKKIAHNLGISYSLLYQYIKEYQLQLSDFDIQKVCKECECIYTPKRENGIFCSKKCRENNWLLNNPQKHREHTIRWILKNRNGCRVCGSQLPFPSAGKKYCDRCLPNHKIIMEQNYAKVAQEKFNAFKISIGCNICGYKKNAAALDYHHMDPDNKERRVTSRMWKTGLGASELQKCILLCKNCHMEQHHKC